MALLWRRGEALHTALARLHAIDADPAAGRADRDAMLPQFEGLDRWLPRTLRDSLVQGIDSGDKSSFDPVDSGAQQRCPAGVCGRSGRVGAVPVQHVG